MRRLTRITGAALLALLLLWPAGAAAYETAPDRTLDTHWLEVGVRLRLDAPPCCVSAQLAFEDRDRDTVELTAQVGVRPIKARGTVPHWFILNPHESPVLAAARLTGHALLRALMNWLWLQQAN